MPGSVPQPDGDEGAGGAAGPGGAAGGDPSPGSEEAAPRPPPEPDDAAAAAAALRLALGQLSLLGLGAAGHEDDDEGAGGGDGGVGGADGGAALDPAPPDGPEPGAPLAAGPAGAPGPLQLLEPDVSPPPRPSPPDVFAGFAPLPGALGPAPLLADQMSVIGNRKKSVNMTECVPVPSSEHVAEIVGRQGCKIKALRAKTNTYIKTPVRGEEPVFIVTGRKEDVELAKREILSAAEHFSLIRATRGKAAGLPGAAQGPPNLPGQTTIQVRVPYRVVGLVVGPKGATIKRIQQRTHTYIVTPGRDKEPVFAVTGMPENVDRAREEIEAHITLRTGALADPGADSDFHTNGTDVCLDLLGASAAGLWAKAPNPARRPSAPTGSLRGDPEAFYAAGRAGPPVPDTGPSSPYGSSGNGGFTFGGDGPGAPAAPEDCDLAFDFLALDLTVPTTATIWAPFERAAPLPAFSACSAVNGGPASAAARRPSRTATPRHSPTLPEPLGALPWLPAQAPRASFSNSSGFAAPAPALDSGACESGRKPAAPAATQECVVCAEGQVMAALVPCGHSLFCMDCALRICGKREPHCPACHTPATQAIHIFS
ncbi:RNA-binding protein MEX3D [Tenrec ecaudatus]|uniref:RNA-binding protein MEX3D n=1 Tax=Tenrec ecaudatus TaxID=94439 RepID=UPI003F5A2A5E